MFNDELGDRMKGYEAFHLKQRIEPPFIVRLDGRGFSTWTKNLNKPYDLGLLDIFRTVTKELLQETNADFAYHQSDEITLGFLKPDKPATQMYFGGKLQKIVSITSSFVTARFNQLVPAYFGKGTKKLAHFDSRVFEVPNDVEAVNALIWRQQDAKRNSIQLLGRSVFSHERLHKKKNRQILKMLSDRGVEWEKEPSFFKYGQLFRKVKTKTTLSLDEIKNLPKKHAARINPDFQIERNIIQQVKDPYYKNIENFFKVILEGAQPLSQYGDLKFRTAWEYTPTLNGTELKQGEKVTLDTGVAEVFGTVKIEEDDVNVEGININRKKPHLEPKGDSPSIMLEEGVRLKRE